MVEAYRRRSPLAHFGLAARIAASRPAEADIVLAERPHRAILSLRARPDDESLRQAMLAVTGLDLPRRANTSAAGQSWKAFWMNPSEYWLTGEPDTQHDTAERLRRELADRHAAIVDLSESRLVLTLRGARIRDFMARATSLDLHPRVFAPGQCAQTVFARIPVLLDQVDAAPSYEIYILKSYADYLWRWFETLGRDFRLAVVSAP